MADDDKPASGTSITIPQQQHELISEHGTHIDDAYDSDKSGDTVQFPANELDPIVQRIVDEAKSRKASQTRFSRKAPPLKVAKNKRTTRPIHQAATQLKPESLKKVGDFERWVTLQKRVCNELPTTQKLIKLFEAQTEFSSVSPNGLPVSSGGRRRSLDRSLDRFLVYNVGRVVSLSFIVVGVFPIWPSLNSRGLWG